MSLLRLLLGLSFLPTRANLASNHIHSLSHSNQFYSMFVFDELGSTMDKAKELLSLKGSESQVDGVPISRASSTEPLVVLTKSQTQGRGTNNRTWMNGEGNLFMTMVIKRSALQIPITLLPLRVGTLIYPSISKRVDFDGSDEMKSSLKWPNDILINDRKVCGTLIEMQDDDILIGIGCNVIYAPDVSKDESGAANGDIASNRPSTCLFEHSRKEEGDQVSKSVSTDGSTAMETVFSTTSNVVHKESYLEMAQEISSAASRWLQSGDNANTVINDFQSRMDLNLKQRIRSGQHKGTEVIPVSINIDGTLRVKVVDAVPSQYITLIADYLW